MGIFEVTPKNVLVHSVLLVLFFVVSRLVIFSFNPTTFAVAGSDFCTPDSISHLVIQQGQGYDGQFFFRQAFDPLEFSKENLGITIDHPAYRVQRVLYPLSAYLLSFGNNTFAPWALILVNILAFIGIIVIFNHTISTYQRDITLSYLPLFLIGLWMALARNLGEIFEVLFVLWALIQWIKKHRLLFMVFAICAILARDTSAIVLAILILSEVIYLISNKTIKSSLVNILVISVPLLVLFVWKDWVYANSPIESSTVTGAQNITWPLKGVFYGLLSNLSFSSMKGMAETVFYLLYFIWNLWIIKIILEGLPNIKALLKKENQLAFVFLGWLIFSLFLGVAIYVDDWGFVRIFSVFNAIGILCIVVYNMKLSKSFWLVSSVMLVFSLLRFIVRV